MTINEIVTAICSALEGSFMVSKSSVTTTGNTTYKDYICVPMGTQDKDGNPQYAKVEVGMFLSKATKANPAFNPEEGISNYEAHVKAQLEKASAPKKSTPKDNEAAQRMENRKNAVRTWVREEADPSKEYTSTEIANLVDGIENAMLAGTVCSKLVPEMFDVRIENGKKFYTPRKS